MNHPIHHFRPFALVMLALATIAASGCALNRLPRIDPTGQRLLLFPDEPTPTVTPLPQSAAPTLAPGATANLPTTPPNVVAPPVYTDPFLPGGNGSTTTTDWLGREVVVGPPVASTTGAPIAGPAVAATPPGEALRITPSRILAPIGSEVVLVGGVCGENGRLRTNERIEWMLDRAGTGQIVTVGNRGELDMFRLLRNTPRKVDNFFAIGSTSPYAECLDRGTPNPNDDIQIRRGDGWVTVTSPTEGTSYVTAYAPQVPNWAGRTARATIYWVDAQWSFPPPVTLAPGESHTLTTTVTRQSDGSPIAGWIVRYRVAGGTAGLGYDQGQASVATTNNQGRASIEITPTDDRPGTTNLAIEIVRPEQAGVGGSPRVTLGQGATSITWADGGISGTPLPAVPPGSFPPLEPTPTSPPTDNSWSSPNPTPTPTPTPTPDAGRADLKVQVDQRTQGPFRAGGEVEYLITVINQGNGVARNVKIIDEFDLGLETDIANPGEQFFKSDPPFDLGAGESKALPPIRFRITQPGRLSHNVIASADNAESDSARAFLTAEAGGGFGAGGGAIEPTLSVTMVGPERHTVGEDAYFRVVVSNGGTSAATNVQITTDFDVELKPETATEPIDLPHYNSTGQIRWQFDRLDAGKELVQEIYCKCTSASGSTCGRVEVSADGLSQAKFDQKCIEIRPQLDGGGLSPPPLSGTPGPSTDGVATGGLDVTIADQGVPRVGQRMTVFVMIENKSGQTQQNVRFRALVPAELQPDLEQLQASVPVQTNNWLDGRVELVFGPIAQMAAGEKTSFVLTVLGVKDGNTQFHVETQSDAIAPRSVSDDIVVLAR